MSNLELVRLKPIRIRLKDAIPDFRCVEGAGELAPILERAQFTESAYVFYDNLTANQNEIAVGGHSQRIFVRFSVAYWVRELSDQRGEAVADVVEVRRDQVLAALVGWAYGDSIIDPISYLGSNLIRYTPEGSQLWADKFITSAYLRNIP